MSATLRVAVLSRHQLTRAGLTRLLSHDGRVSVVAGPVRTGRLRTHDLVVFDLTGHPVTIPDDLARVVADGAPVVALVPCGPSRLIGAALALGVVATVGVDSSQEELVQALTRARAGPIPIASAPGHPAEPPADRLTDRLTDRELEILELVGRGLTNQEIAGELFLSINTVKTYIRSAYRKAGVTRRSEAVLWAVRNEPAAPWAS